MKITAGVLSAGLILAGCGSSSHTSSSVSSATSNASGSQTNSSGSSSGASQVSAATLAQNEQSTVSCLDQLSLDYAGTHDDPEQQITAASPADAKGQAGNVLYFINNLDYFGSAGDNSTNVSVLLAVYPNAAAASAGRAKIKVNYHASASDTMLQDGSAVVAMFGASKDPNADQDARQLVGCVAS